MNYVNILSTHTDSFQFMVVSTPKYIQRNKISAVILIHFVSIVDVGEVTAALDCISQLRSPSLAKTHVASAISMDSERERMFVHKVIFYYNSRTWICDFAVQDTKLTRQNNSGKWKNKNIVCDLASAKIRSLRHVIPYEMEDKCQHFRETYLAYYTTSLSVGS